MIGAATGCFSIDWALLPDRDLVEAILTTPPFAGPLSIEVESSVAKSCEQVMSEKTPRVWISLKTASVATLGPVALKDGSLGCAIEPSGRGPTLGKRSGWKLSQSGSQWMIPVGSYMIDGTPDGGVNLERSHVGSPTVSFPWTFNPFRRMAPVVLAHTNAGSGGLSGRATANLTLTDEGWKVVSIEMKTIQSRVDKERKGEKP
jgi:hypothetical protein